MNGARAFVDTNVLVYAQDAGEPGRMQEAADFVDALLDEGRAVISTQVVQEFINVMRRGEKPKRSVEECAWWLEYFHQRFAVVPISRVLQEKALSLHERYRLSWYDALIVAAAQVGNCELLYSEDLQAGQQFGPVRVVNPFR